MLDGAVSKGAGKGANILVFLAMFRMPIEIELAPGIEARYVKLHLPGRGKEEKVERSSLRFITPVHPSVLATLQLYCCGRAYERQSVCKRSSGSTLHHQSS